MASSVIDRFKSRIAKVKIPRLKLNPVLESAYTELDEWADGIRKKYPAKRLDITTELQSEDPTAPIPVAGIYLVANIFVN